MTEPEHKKGDVPAAGAAAKINAKPKLLVVDDEVGFRDLIIYAFQEEYQVLTAANGEEAVQKAAAKDIDVVISDIAMPKLGGLEMLKALKAIDHAIEVILVSGYATRENAIESVKLGAFDYITKPFDIVNLSQLVSLACAARLARRRV